MRSVLVLGLLVVTGALAGCLSSEAPDDGGEGSDVAMLYGGHDNTTVYHGLLDTGERTFTEPGLIDATRAGGEPVIAVTLEGSYIVMAHPGWTHYHPTTEDPDHSELLTPASGQSYLWRSTDQGETWTHIGAAGMEEGPRSVGTGFSDPDLTVDATGRIWYTDLQALAEQSVSYSDDDGQTWTAGNVVAGAGPYVDRQWIGSHGDRVYLTANYFVDRSGGESEDGARPFQTTNDDGLTWETLGYAPCGGDFLADPRDGAIVMACGLGIAVSTDEGATWTEHESPAGIHTGFFAHEPAIDAAGGVYVAANGQPLTPHDPNSVRVSYTPDRGETWKVLELDPLIREALGSNGTHVFAWVSAGAEGRAAVSWIATAEEADRPDDVQGPWFLYTAFLTGMHTDVPTVELVQITPDPVHVGPMCTSGTTCQVQSVALDPLMGTDTGDRRMGDFFETTIDPDGTLVYVFANTNAVPDDVISHPAFIKQTGGPDLLGDAAWPEGWPTQG